MGWSSDKPKPIGTVVIRWAGLLASGQATDIGHPNHDFEPTI